MKRNYDPDDVERRIMAEAIEEVAGLENNNIADPEIVVENAGVEQSGQPTYGIPRLSWFDYMDNSRLQGSHVSHQRNGNSMANPNITLPEVIPRIIPDVDNLPDATNEDLMELGIYAIPGLARPLFDKVNPPKVHSTPVSRLQHPPSVPTSANLAITTDVSAVNQAPLDPPVIQTPVDLEQPTTTIIQHQQEPQEQAANVQANDQIEPNQGHSQNGTTPARPQDARAKPSRGTLQIENTASNMTLQRQILETVRQELVPDTRTDQQKAKKRVARPRKQAVQPSRRVRTQPMHKELIFHTKKTTRPNQPHQQLTIHFQKNILEGLDNYVVFERDSEPVDVEAIIRELTIDDTVNPEMEEDQVQPVQQQQQVPEWEENLIEMQAAPQAPQTNDIPQRGSTSNFIPDGSINQEPVASSTLRPSLIQHVLRPSMHRNGTANSPNVLSQNVTPESVQVDRHVDNPDRPIAKDVPVATGAIPKSRVSQIPASDIEFARLSHMSRQRQMSNSGEQMQIPDEVSGQNRPKEAHFFEFNGQSEVLINLEGHDGRREIYSKYCMEVSYNPIFAIFFIYRTHSLNIYGRFYFPSTDY